MKKSLWLLIMVLFVGFSLSSQSIYLKKQPFYISSYQGLGIKLALEFNTEISGGLMGSSHYVITLMSLGVSNNMVGPPTYIDYKGKRYYKNKF